ncbi:BgTH12-01447 [Blumeria graminis f. sp. triticale]|uniref:BgTH12-01447 n=1 Tax=Blumeria graminis f. sp. triticale TaxID=1689686 RepID=A0A9W4CZ16_BLUGR|nr:BgTH12-01447 [Blumeria graminis f. sp. triticale]
MSKFQELYTYQEHNSIEYILQKCRKRISKGFTSKSVLDRLYHDLFEYAAPLQGKSNMEELSMMFKSTMNKVLDGIYDLEMFNQLIQHIRDNKNERDILQLAIDLGTKFITKSSMDTKDSLITWKRNTTEILGFGKTVEQLNDILKKELQDNIFCVIPNFWDNFFVGKEWTDQASRIWESYEKYEIAEKQLRSKELEGKNSSKDVEEQKTLHGAKEEKILEENMTESEIWDWLYFFEENFLKQLKCHSSRSTKYPVVIESKGSLIRGRYCRTNSTQRSDESEGKTQIDFLIKSVDLPNDDVDWKNMNVGGEFSISPSKQVRKDKFLQLSRCVREAYCAQPLRRFMHGFLMFKEEFELWVFDRSGAYSSGRKSIADAKEMFVRAICSYLLMSDEELGRDLSISKINGQSAVRIKGDNEESIQLFDVKSYPVVRPRSLINRATTCYETQNKLSMIKYSWSRSETNAEVQFMKDALTVPGVVKYITSDLVYQTNNHLGSLNLSDAQPCDLKAEEIIISPGTNYHNMALPSLERNRFLFRIVMTPCGRKINSSGSILAFVVGIRDAIKAHQALVDKNILHGDISDGNIILIDPTLDKDCHGLLIDFDCSVRLKDNVAEDDERFLTGTLKFMALERLFSDGKTKAIRRTYRHDLESFFYVFIVGSIEYEFVNGGMSHNLDDWCVNIIKQCYSNKRVHIYEFPTLLNMFTPSFKELKQLAKNLRTILFEEDGSYISTPNDRGSLYRRMIEAFDDTIEDIKAGKIKNPTFIARRQ